MPAIVSKGLNKLGQKRNTDDSTHRRDIETEQTATDDGDGRNNVNVSHGIHGCFTPLSKEGLMCKKRHKQRNRSCLMRAGLVL